MTGETRGIRVLSLLQREQGVARSLAGPGGIHGSSLHFYFSAAFSHDVIQRRSRCRVCAERRAVRSGGHIRHPASFLLRNPSGFLFSILLPRQFNCTLRPAVLLGRRLLRPIIPLGLGLPLPESALIEIHRPILPHTPSISRFSEGGFLFRKLLC